MNTATRPQPNPRDRISLAYDATLAATTRFGSVLTALDISSFLLWYWLAGYPRPVLWAGLAALLAVLAGCAIAYYLERYRVAAHLTILGAYLSVVGTVLFTGGIESTRPTIELETLLKAADQALYQAKRNGRNRVCVAATL